VLRKIRIDLLLNVVGFYRRLERIEFLGDLSGRFIVLLKGNVKIRRGCYGE